MQPLVRSLPVSVSLPEPALEEGVERLSFDYSIPASGPVSPANPLGFNAQSLFTPAQLPLLGQTPLMGSVPSQFLQSPLYGMVLPPFSAKKPVVVSVPLSGFAPAEGASFAAPPAAESIAPGVALPPLQSDSLHPPPAEPEMSSLPAPTLMPSLSQPVAQSMPQSMLQSMAQSMTQSMAQSMTQPMAQSMTQPVAQSMTQPVAQSMTQPMTRSMTQPVAQSMTQPVAQSMTQPMTQPTAQSTPAMVPVFSHEVTELISDTTTPTQTEKPAPAERNISLESACRDAGVVMYNCKVEIKAVNNYGLSTGFQEEMKQKLSEITTEIAQLKKGSSSEGFSQDQIQDIANRIETITRVLQMHTAEDPRIHSANVSV